MPQICVEGLVKTFFVAERRAGTLGALRGLLRRRSRPVPALGGVSFSVEPGELVGYVGPNGAGKSTTLKILSGILVPDAGRCEVFGAVPWQQRRRHVAQIGVVFGQRTQLWWDLPVIESFELLRAIYRIPAQHYRVRCEELFALLDVVPLLDVPVRLLSLGQRMRCDLVAALLHDPRLLFLDEPTIGLDATAKLAVRDFIVRLNRERGVTVILTTHDMDDVEALCERVLVVAHGRILWDGTLERLRQRAGSERRLIIELSDDGPLQVEGTRRIAARNGRVELAFDPRALAASELVARISAKHAVRDLLLVNPPIDHIIAELYRAAAGKGAA
jgi:ABC-2 type transport system ATP-binding protein